MDAIKIFLIIFFFPFFIAAQQSKYPKDTIYLKFKDTVFNNPNMKAKSFHTFNNKKGIKFWWEKKWLFHQQGKKTDTLCYRHLKDYTFLNDLKEIRKKHNNWIDRKFKNSKYKPYNGYLNSSFITYLIEVISKEKFVIYPVIWRNEGTNE